MGVSEVVGNVLSGEKNRGLFSGIEDIGAYNVSLFGASIASVYGRVEAIRSPPLSPAGRRGVVKSKPWGLRSIQTSRFGWDLGTANAAIHGYVGFCFRIDLPAELKAGKC